MPNISDILPIFFLDSGVTSYKNLANITAPFANYYSYGDLSNGVESGEDVDIFTTSNTLRQAESTMKADRNATTIDLFMRGNIGMIIGYPSLINELVLSQKTCWCNYFHDRSCIHGSIAPIFSTKFC